MPDAQASEELDEDVPPSVERLLEVIELERLDRDLFRGFNPEYGGGFGRLFGGQVAAQALRAATYTVEDQHHPHSLHGYFLRPGRPGIATILHVDRVRNGKSFTTRRVTAVQNGETIFTLEASFHKDEPGGDYAVPVPRDLPHPDADVGWREHPFRPFRSPFEMREFEPDPPDEHGVYHSTRRIWVRTRGRLPDDRALHACVLTYISDMGAVGAARVPLNLPWGMGASLDHAVWFHRPIRPDEWVLFDMRPLSVAGARGLVVGAMYGSDGTLGASMTQEALVRDQRSKTK